MVSVAVIERSNPFDGLVLETSPGVKIPAVKAREANRMMPRQLCFQGSSSQPKHAARISFNSNYLAPDSRPKNNPVASGRKCQKLPLRLDLPQWTQSA